MKTIAHNNQARFKYSISETYEAGIVLSGSEVKAIKTGHISLKESFVSVKGAELFLVNAHIPPYQPAGDIKNYDPTRPRKLLLKKSEINNLIGKMHSQGLTLVPIRVYTKKRLLKLEFGIGKGKKQYDKRDSIAKREMERKMDRALKNRRRFE
jgi:SsrA-binding protein